ncbi:MAG: hypothetical protein EAZ53_17110 [Bacteroidetes bacterium]|nr:MAG: hypothetical protein EAZ53_17110 [Bacteroidota bacterium]
MFACKSDETLSPTSMPLDAVCVAPTNLDMTGANNWGNGTPASCTQIALQTLITAGGKINCNCGNNPFTLILTSSLEVPARKEVIIDGKNILTISGNNTVRIFDKQAPANQSDGTLFAIQNMKLINGKANNELGGAAILGRYFGSLKVINVSFSNHTSQLSNADACGAVHTGGYKEVLFANCIFNNNRAANGAAVGTIGSAQTFINCRFENNEATGTGGTFDKGGSGGAIYVDGVDQNGINNSMSICGCTFINNKAAYQAGALNVIFYAGKGSTIAMDKCSFEGNSCTPDKAGAFYFMNGSLNLTNSTFADNTTTGLGGAIWTSNYNATINNCTFKGNNAVNGNDGLGGALALDGSGTTKIASITNCTFAENRAGNFASAIFNGGRLTLTNNLFYKNKVGIGNQSNADAGAVINKETDLILNPGNMQFPKEYTSQFGTANDNWITTSVLTTDAGLLPLADNTGGTKTMAIPTNSTAKDAGTSINAPTKDQRGKPRVGNVDIGAFEVQ